MCCLTSSDFYPVFLFLKARFEIGALLNYFWDTIDQDKRHNLPSDSTRFTQWMSKVIKKNQRIFFPSPWWWNRIITWWTRNKKKKIKMALLVKGLTQSWITFFLAHFSFLPALFKKKKHYNLMSNVLIAQLCTRNPLPIRKCENQKFFAFCRADSAWVLN